MKFISNFSGGLCSWWAHQRTVEKFGAANVVKLFADVLIETEDLYEFNRHSETVDGIPVTRISLELSPFELFRREGMIANNQFPICSTKLKREPLNGWMARHFELDANQTNAIYGPATVVLGFDHTEFHRVKEFQDEHPTWRVIAPMTEAPFWDKCRMMAEAEKLGFKTSILYKLGLPHNNCGGACVRAGISHFVRLYHRLPSVFWMWAAEELYTQQHMRARGIANWNYTILKDRRGGETKPLPLIELAYRIKSGEKFSENDWGGCGCGGVN